MSDQLMTREESLTASQLGAFFQGIQSCFLAQKSKPDVDFLSLITFFTEVKVVIDQADARQRADDRVHAGRFNLLALIDPDENKLSDLVASLLDPHGRHGQGDRFLRLLLERLQLSSIDQSSSSVRVIREAPTHGIDKYKRRIDILIEGGVLVAIENKIDAIEQYEQVKDYLEHLRVISGNWSIAATLIYLTPNGRRPDHLTPHEREEFLASGRLHCWSYSRELRAWLESCLVVCEADKVRHFLSDFVAYIQSDLSRAAIREDAK